MKYIKKFEMNEVGTAPQEGDYVICNSNDHNKFSTNIEKLNNFTMSHVGRIVQKNESRYTSSPYRVEYDNVPDEYYNTNFIFKQHEILYWSTDKEELELLINTNKFNI